MLWGVYYFALQVLERFVFRGANERMPRALRHIGTMLLVLIGWVLFYYTDFSALGQHVAAMFGMSFAGGFHLAPLFDDKLIAVLQQYTVLPLLMLGACLPVVPWLKRVFAQTERRKRVGDVLATVAATGLLILSVVFLMGQTYNPFIYFRF